MADVGEPKLTNAGAPRWARSPRLLVLLAALLWAAPAGAVQYETEIDIEAEQDLYDLQLEGEISETTLETLLELYRIGVDLNLADSEELYELPNITYAEVKAILVYRKLVGRIGDPSDLVAADVVTPKLLVQIAPFLVVSDGDPRSGGLPLAGRAQFGMGYSNAEGGAAPPMYLRSRLKGPLGLSAGLLLVTTRRRLGDVMVDEFREPAALSAASPGFSAHLPKLFLEWKRAKYGVIVGSYRIGFGERLTLDNTTRYTPDGYYADDVVFIPQDLEGLCRESKGELGESPCNETDNFTAVTPDFSWRDSFRGVAARVQAPVGDMSLKATVFGSYQSRSVYQYQLYNRRTCDDPHDESSDCDAPSIYVRGADPTQPSSKFMYVTVPDVYDELAGGGNVSLKLSHLGHVGVTGYYVRNNWRMQSADLDLDFQEWARTPYGGPYGAVGVNGGLTLGLVNLFAEAARSFDSMPDGGGGFGILQRTTLSALAQEFELVLRYYGRDFANPYARATAAPDQYDGLRSRNEAGARLRYRGAYTDWVFNGDADFWVWPEDSEPGTKGTSNFAAKARVQFMGYDFIRPWGSLEYKNKDLARSGGADGTSCYESGDEEDALGETKPCSGSFYRAAAGFKLSPIRALSFELRYQHEWLDDPKHPNDLRQDSVVRATIAYRPIDQLQVRLRSRYLFEDISDDTYLEESVWTYLQVTWFATKQIKASLRYDLLAMLDERQNTLDRNRVWNDVPEQRMRLELETSF